jgi:hypothetical protein
MHDEEYVRKCKEWIARRKARLDQKEKMFEDQYPLMRPRENNMRLQDLEAWRFEIEFNEWELGEIIKGMEEPDETQDG